jgi:hypothetical protein
MTVMACLFAVFFLPPLLGYHQWLFLGDGKSIIKSAQYVADGGLGSVYSVSLEYLPLPGFLLVLAPFAALGDHLGLVNGYPFPLPHPSMLLVMAPVFAACGSTAVLGADYLADALGVSRRRRRVLAPAVGLVVVAPTVCWAGHPEDLLALTGVCFSLGLLVRGRHLPAAAMLGVAVMMQPWAVLLVPLMTLATPSSLRIRSLVCSSALPALTGLTLLGLDWSDAYRSLVIQPMLGYGQHLPWWPLSHKVTVFVNGAPVPVRVGSAPRLLAVLVALAAPVALRRNLGTGNIILVASVVVVARAIFETQVWCYYLGPAAVLMAVGAATAPGTRRWVAGAVCAFVFYGFVAGAYDAYSMPAYLALAVLLACTAGALSCCGPLRRPTTARR